jgi:hypothetical protein
MRVRWERHTQHDRTSGPARVEKGTSLYTSRAPPPAPQPPMCLTLSSSESESSSSELDSSFFFLPFPEGPAPSDPLPLTGGFFFLGGILAVARRRRRCFYTRMRLFRNARVLRRRCAVCDAGWGRDDRRMAQRPQFFFFGKTHHDDFHFQVGAFSSHEVFSFFWRHLGAYCQYSYIKARWTGVRRR